MSVVVGEVDRFLSALGKSACETEFVRATALVGPQVEVQPARIAGREYWSFDLGGAIFLLENNALKTVFIQLAFDPDEPNVATYRRPETLFREIDARSSRKALEQFFGPPHAQGDEWVSFESNNGILHFGFDSAGQTILLTLSASMP